MSNPNGLSDSQIAARPEPFVGMLYWRPCAEDWRVAGPNLVRWCIGAPFEFLLPGEPGCPWPPPEEFRHEWKVGDRAYVRSVPAVINESTWKTVSVKYRKSDGLRFECKTPSGLGKQVFPVDRPAIYIPEKSKR